VGRGVPNENDGVKKNFLVSCEGTRKRTLVMKCRSTLIPRRVQGKKKKFQGQVEYVVRRGGNPPATRGAGFGDRIKKN